jgi:hypothetical protein
VYSFSLLRELLKHGPSTISRNLHRIICLGLVRQLLTASAASTNASVHAGAENRAEIHLQPSRSLCQRQISGFHRYLLGFAENVPFLAHFDRN